MAGTKRNVYIHAPQLLSRGQRFANAALTAVMWAFYSYLWAPLISLVAWLLGFEFAYDVLVRAGGLQLLQDVIIFYGVMVALIFVVVAGWSIINRGRFAHRNRRKAVPTVTQEEITSYFGITPKQLAALRQSRIVRVGLGDSGDIQRVESPLIRVDNDFRLSIRPEAAVAENEADQDDDENGSVVQRSI